MPAQGAAELSASAAAAVSEEAARLAALEDFGLLDGVVDAEVDAVTRLAALVAGVPSASVHLLTAQRQCQLSGVEFADGDAAREDSLCAVQLHTRRFVLVPDARLDERYAHKPFVTGERGSVRFYASAPLLTAGGEVLGTLCVVDTEPGELDARQVAALEDLARVLVGLFERRRQARLAQQHATEAVLLAAQAERSAARAEQHAAEAAEQRALAELAVAEAEARYELSLAVLESVDVGIVVAGPDGRLSEFNRTARTWHGLDADAALDPAEHAGAYDLYGPDGTTALTAAEVPLHRTLAEGRVRDVEMVIAPAGREPVTVRCSGRTVTRADGSPLGAVVAMSDVTALRARKRRLEAALADLERSHGELERSNGELAQFAGTVSHDLNSPLMVVDGYLELLQDTCGAQLDEQARAWIATARRGAGRMQDLIAALLDYARAGAQTCRREPVDLGAVLEQAVGDLHGAVEEAGARIGARGLPGADPSGGVLGDEVLLRQLLQNLVGNAVKYRHPQRPCRVELSAVREGEGWTVSVADNGIGIPAGQREAVFGMFTQVDPSARGGHGIGLATCQRIVTRHGGRVWAEETPGGGTTVRFTLPSGAPQLA
ncbi:sensor histidine kinase [Kineococcus gypseus]|uniref:sensor histidine kinase n=1 Tax=Kineococcus gypseus TaxID=1637102 RepID=UPI003D7CB7C6